MPVALLEFVMFAAVLIVGVSQVIVPIWRGRPIFPIFTSKELRLLREAERERQRQLEMQLTRNLTRQTLRELDIVEMKEPFDEHNLEQ